MANLIARKPLAERTVTQKDGRTGGLTRSIGFYGLMFVSLGSIIGSGWLLGALKAAQVAGPASILSWVLAACMLSLLALTYAELGATYPVAGGAARFPYYSHGPIAGFICGWASWLQAVFVAPIEVLAVITYVNSVGWVNQHFNMIGRMGANAGLLNESGLVVAILLMVLFTTMNLAGTKFLSDSNVSANLIIYWGGFETTWKLACAMVVGLVLFAVGAWRSRTGAQHTIRNAFWIGPWLGGQVLIGWLGRYGNGSLDFLPNWVDIAVIMVFSLAIFYWAVSLTLTRERTAAAVAKDAQQIDYATRR